MLSFDLIQEVNNFNFNMKMHFLLEYSGREHNLVISSINIDPLLEIVTNVEKLQYELSDRCQEIVSENIGVLDKVTPYGLKLNLYAIPDISSFSLQESCLSFFHEEKNNDVEGYKVPKGLLTEPQREPAETDPIEDEKLKVVLGAKEAGRKKDRVACEIKKDDVYKAVETLQGVGEKVDKLQEQVQELHGDILAKISVFNKAVRENKLDQNELARMKSNVLTTGVLYANYLLAEMAILENSLRNSSMIVNAVQNYNPEEMFETMDEALTFADMANEEVGTMMFEIYNGNPAEQMKKKIATTKAKKTIMMKKSVPNNSSTDTSKEKEDDTKPTSKFEAFYFGKK